MHLAWTWLNCHLFSATRQKSRQFNQAANAGVMSNRSSILTEKVGFLCNGILIIGVVFLITRAILDCESSISITAQVWENYRTPELFGIAVVPLLLSPFFFFAATVRRSGQSLASFRMLYLVSAAIGLYCLFVPMPIVGIYIVLCSLGLFIYGHRQNYS